jgi:hypothetical protein
LDFVVAPGAAPFFKGGYSTRLFLIFGCAKNNGPERKRPGPSSGDQRPINAMPTAV